METDRVWGMVLVSTGSPLSKHTSADTYSPQYLGPTCEGFRSVLQPFDVAAKVVTAWDLESKTLYLLPGLAYCGVVAVAGVDRGIVGQGEKLLDSMLPLTCLKASGELLQPGPPGKEGVPREEESAHQKAQRSRSVSGGVERPGGSTSPTSVNVAILRSSKLRRGPAAPRASSG